MHLQNNTSLKAYNTFGIDVKASQFCSIENEDDLIPVLKQNTLPLFIISGGSNMLLTQNIEALVLHIKTKGIDLEKKEDSTLVTAKAGENWHEFVQFCISKNLGGLENLSLIPGCVGSSPIQNIGAYGVELKDCFVSCKALNLETFTYKVFKKSDCNFGYRDSIFKNEVKDKYELKVADAWDKYEKKDLSNAKIICSQIKDEFPDKLGANYLLGIIYLDENKFIESSKELKTALKKDKEKKSGKSF